LLAVKVMEEERNTEDREGGRKKRRKEGRMEGERE
jgi:hypothetical protein